MMIIVFILSLFVLAFMIGTFRVRELEAAKMRKTQSLLPKGDFSMEGSFKDLKIEGNQADIVDRYDLMRRGSWRLAQSRFLTEEQFEELKAVEYAKKL